MKSRPLPNPANYKNSNLRWLQSDPQVKKWSQRLLGDPDAKLPDLPEDSLAFILAQVEQRRQMPTTPIYQAMVETCPTIVAPEITNSLADIELVSRQPEIVEFWHKWDGPRGKRGPAVDWSKAKAALAYLSLRRPTVTLETACEDIDQKPGFQDLFAALDAAAGGERGPDFTMPPYKSLARQVQKASRGCRVHAIESNIALVRELARLCPKAGIGKRLLIDGTNVCAWAEQRGSRGDQEREDFLRRRTPDAGFRAYGYGKNGKAPVAESDLDKAPTTKTKWWRGYYLVVICDQASGLPLVWILFDATLDEAPAIIPLLSDLYRLWPDCPAEVIAGDSAWDEEQWCRLCEVEYGIHPVFRIHPSREKDVYRLKAGASRDGSVAAITGTGQLICRAHDRELPYETFESPQRHGLRPGQTASEGEFRLRAVCRHIAGSPPCGRIGLRAQTQWRSLTFYPHHPHGHAKRYAMRQALLLRTNQIESLFNRMKSAGIAANDADRHRFFSIDTVEAIISIHLLGMTALTVAEQRQKLGVMPSAHPKPAAKPVVAVPAAAPPPAPVSVPQPAKVAAQAPGAKAAPGQLPIMQVITGGQAATSFTVRGISTGQLQFFPREEKAS